MDPLSEMLALLGTQSSVFAGLKAGGPWALDFPPPEGIKFNAVVHGTCELSVDGEQQPIPLKAGDCFLLSRQRAFSLGSDLALPAVNCETVYRHAVNGIAHCGNAGEFFLIGGRFAFGEEAALLFDALPAVAVIKHGSEQASVLRWALERLAHELTQPSPGSSLMVQHFGHIMLVQVLRIYLAQEASGPPSWLLALSDPRLGSVLQAIHAAPARRWTVEDLAQVAGVSRSTLALKFKQKAGASPLEYVLRWRMQLATRALRNSQVTISSIAQKLGYDSDSAFSNAFKRIMNCSPREYRKRQNAASM
ncbi:AraC family transcriptional regulator [Pseudomonas typographi]|uniref:AraC family transcriptional regulator n=1 Tax=Pseudomonas typographi TaxID=2715964 RepID=A0ABR7Z9D3_9PSED|nr:AraC family transcriptional regulator [Pseudomonas typographi]MBD1554451.1 AraC family transcriptional regulator [Pseudomonas typographi]MBD1589939.1 AraC family transcriptional regulator [Pseudomonas typographi]MBD1602042.1 AraC family transcriptional regulator [Pseudomonas typographi]